MYKYDYKLPGFINTASFWTKNTEGTEKTIIDLDKIKSFNSKIKLKIPSLNSLDTDEGALSGKALEEYIKSYKLPSKDMYDSEAQLVNKDFYEKIIHNTNLDGIKDYNPIKYGISTKKISIRSFPTDSAVFSSIEHSKLNNFDRFQETGCNACEALLILHESCDKNWYFVKMYNYFGWTKSDGVALSLDKKQIFDYVCSEDFLIVTGKEISLTIDDVTLKCGMSTKLFLSHHTESSSEKYYTVKYPVRDSSGMLLFKKAVINKNEDVIKGYLSYTRCNIINQAFKYLDTPYDWGEKFKGKDCSGFIMTIYRCFGFWLPRNADEQENSFYDLNNSIIFNNEDTLEIRYSKMDKLKPGAALFKDGHVMMYLGKYDGTHYMIHSFAGYSVKKGSSYEPRMALCTAVSSVDLPTSNGKSFIEEFTSAVQYE